MCPECSLPLYLYTDGVTEATDSTGKLFGEGRLLAALNKFSSDGPAHLLADVRSEIDKFVGDAPQFDDITMVGLKYNGPAPDFPA